MATNTAASFSTPTANGTAGPFNIGFTYLAQSEIDVTVDGVLKTLNTHYIFHSTTQISFTSGNFPSAGQAIKFQRNTDLSAKKVDFQNGSVLTEADLDSNSDQVLFGLQEFVDEINNNVIKRDGTQTITNNLVFEGSSDDANETTLGVVNPTADRTINLPNVSGTVVTTGDTGTVTTDMIGDDQVTPAKIGNADLKSLSNCQTGSAASLANLTNNEVAILDGATVSTTELNTLDGVNSTLTASELNTLDGITASTANLNQLTGKEVETSVTGNSNAKIPTSKAVNDLVLAVTNALGGFVAIADKTSFPTSHPDPSENAGTVVSITDANGIVVNSSGVATISNGAGSSTVTINGFPTDLRSKTLGSGIGLQVQTTTTLHTYDYHKALIKESDLVNFSADVDSFRSRYRVVSSTPTSDNDEGDIIYRTSDDKLLIYNGTAFQDPLIGNFHINTLSSYNGTGGNTATFNGSAYRFNINHAPEQAQQLLVSINGVIQKPNSGTSQPSEGFALDGDSILFGAAPASGSDFFIITIGKSVNIGVVSDGTIDNAKVASDASIEGTKINPNFGSQNISTTGTLGTGDITISTTAPLIKFDETDQTTDYFIVANNNTLTLARNNLNTPNHIQKWNSDGHVDFLTNVDFASGIDVTGDLTVTTGALTITSTLPQINLTDSDNSDWYVANNNGTFRVRNTTNSVDGLMISSSGQVDFAGNVDCNSGLDVTGNTNITGNLVATGNEHKFTAGTSGDLKVILQADTDNNNESDSPHLLFRQDGELDEGAIFLANNKFNIASTVASGGGINFRTSTTNSGYLTADVRMNITPAGQITMYGNVDCNSGLDVTGEITGTSHIDLPDDATLKLGDNDEFTIFHNSINSNSIIRESGGGVLTLQTNGSAIGFYDIVNQRDMATFNTNGSCVLKHAANIRLETTSTGIKVDKIVTIDGSTPRIEMKVTADEQSHRIEFYNTADSIVSRIYGHPSGDLELQTGSNGNESAIKVNSNGAVDLHFDGGTYSTAKLSTTATGVTVDGKIGIGTSNPARPLTIRDSDCRIRLEDPDSGNTNNASVELSNNNGNGYLNVNNNNSLNLQTDNQARLTISGTGDVELTETLKLQNNKNLNLGGSNNLVLKFDGSVARILADSQPMYLKGLNGSATQAGITMYKGNSAEKMFEAFNDGAVKLYFDGGTYGTAKLETTATGVDVNGVINVTSSANGLLTLTSTTRHAGFTMIDSVGSSGLQNRDGNIRFLAGGNASGSGASDVLFINGSLGRVGIGTTSVGATLHLSSTLPEIRFTDTDNSNIDHFISCSGSAMTLSADHNQEDNTGDTTLRFKVDGTERGRFDDAGLDVTGTVVATGDGTFDDLRIGQWLGDSNYGGIYHKDQSGGEYMMISNDASTFLSASTGGSVIIRGGNNTNTNQLEVDPTSGVNITAANNVNILNGNLLLSNSSLTNPVIQMKNDSNRGKIQVWNSSAYAIGMGSGYSYGSLDSFAMTFQMYEGSETNDRGWVFIRHGTTNAQGAMSLTTNGRMTVAHSMRLGYGIDDTTASGVNHALDVSGNANITGTLEAKAFRFGDSHVKRISVDYTGGGTPPNNYLIDDEFQEILTITPSGNSQNYSIIGRIMCTSGAKVHTIDINVALRSNTLPDLTVSGSYVSTITGDTEYLTPRFWLKETSTAAFKLVVEINEKIFGRVTADLEIISRSEADLDNIVVNETEISEVTSITTGYAQTTPTKVYESDDGVISFDGALTAGGLTFPTSNGTDGQVLTSTGTGTVQWEDAAGGSTFTSGLTVSDASGTSITDPTLTLNHSNIDVTGRVIRLGRADGSDRYHEIIARSSATAANNFIGFMLHDASSTTSMTQILTISPSHARLFSGDFIINNGKLDVSGNVETQNILPNDDDTYDIGTGNKRYDDIFATNTTISTSDERLKQDIQALTTAEKAVATTLKGLIKTFKYKKAVAAKGDKARIHCGVIAQEVKTAFEAQGLKAEDYALFCYDEWDAVAEEKDEDGNITQPAVAAGNRYSIRYSELLAFIISVL